MKPSNPLDPYNKYMDSFHVNRTLHEKLVHIPSEMKQRGEKCPLIKRIYKPILTVATCCLLLLMLNYIRPLFPSSNKDLTMSPPKEEQNDRNPSNNSSSAEVDTSNQESVGIHSITTTYQRYLTARKDPTTKEEVTTIPLTTITEDPKYSLLLPTKLLEELSTKTVIQYGDSSSSNYAVILDKNEQSKVRLSLHPLTKEERSLVVSPNDTSTYSLKGGTVTEQSTATQLLPIFPYNELSPDIIATRAYYGSDDNSTASYSFGLTDDHYVIIYEITDMTPDEIYDFLNS